MPEGDTILRTALTLQRVLAGRTVQRFESVLPALTRIDEDQPIVGRRIESVSARGKHLLIAFSGDLILHTHMRMNGVWHLYRPGVRWRRPHRDMRVLIATSDAVAVGFTVPVAEFLTSRDLQRHADLRSLGPDVLSASFDPAEATRRIREHPKQSIGDVLISQRVVSGVGNLFKSEILFVSGIDPFTEVNALSDPQLERIVGAARELMTRSATSPRRQTTRSVNPNATLWVYGRGGLPCRRCGTPIQSRKTGPEARITFWCPRCQPAA
jgi:endonuclease-8